MVGFSTYRAVARDDSRPSRFSCERVARGADWLEVYLIRDAQTEQEVLVVRDGKGLALMPLKSQP